jgi:CDP-diacylglycerol--serine O-phosphatidyltransferase
MQKDKIIGFYNWANTITCFGLCLSLAACVFAFRGNMPLAMTLFVAAGLCDLFDGPVAKRIKRDETQKAYGVQLDSLADCVSFGVAPCVISYACGFDAWWSLLIYGVYILHAVVRLAYFNVAAAGKSPHYFGVPVTYAALALPVFMLFKNQAAIAVMFAVMGVLFVVKIKIPKPKGVWYAIFPLVAAALVTVWWMI